jgi:VIT1/CCC1 family predicted Fe2+/Mn2+ transporter
MFDVSGILTSQSWVYFLPFLAAAALALAGKDAFETFPPFALALAASILAAAVGVIGVLLPFAILHSPFSGFLASQLGESLQGALGTNGDRV